MVQPVIASDSPVLLVDGSNLLIRILKAKTSGGVLLSPSEVIESCSNIFIISLSHFVKKYLPSRVYVFFDLNGSARKQALASDYKANRTKATAGLSHIFGDDVDPYFILQSKTVELCRLFSIPVMVESGIEADDLIGYAAETLSKLGTPCVIASNDTDFLQLAIYPKVTLHIPYKKADVTNVQFGEYFNNLKGVAIIPSEYVLFKAIVGDKTDHINGIRGMGYKTLYKKLQEYLSDSEHKALAAIYSGDKLSFLDAVVEHGASAATKHDFEALIEANLDTIRLNFKLIELSSSYVSSRAQMLVTRFLSTVPDRPSKKLVIQGYFTLFGSSPKLAFVDGTIQIMSRIYSTCR